MKAAVVCESSQGFVSGETFSSLREYNALFKELNAAFEDGY